MRTRVLPCEDSTEWKRCPRAHQRDLDGDGLDDLFELTYPAAFPPLNPTNAAGDFDGDGLDKVEEYHREADPTDPTSRALVRVSTAPAADETGVGVQ